MRPTISVVMTSHNRPAHVLEAVFSSLTHFPGNQSFDELVVVNDRGDRAVIERAAGKFGLSPVIVEIPGEPGHRCPSAAWNAGFRAASGTHLYCLSSDTIQLPFSMDTARWIAGKLPDMITFGRAEHCGRRYSFIYKGTHVKTMLSSYTGRALGFVWIVPKKWIGGLTPYGYDEAYMGGFCFEDDDIMARLHLAGADFLICDDICGVHIEHSRELLSDQVKVTRNKAIFDSKGLEQMVGEAGIGVYMVGPGIQMQTASQERYEAVVNIFAGGYNNLT